MAKRFINCEMLDSSDYLNLSSEMRFLQLTLIIEANNIGIFEKHLPLLSFKVGFDVTEEMLLSTGMSVEKIGEGRYWLTKFCKHQYGILKNNPSNKPHSSYIKALKEEGLIDRVETTINNKKTEEEIDKIAKQIGTNS